MLPALVCSDITALNTKFQFLLDSGLPLLRHTRLDAHCQVLHRTFGLEAYPISLYKFSLVLSFRSVVYDPDERGPLRGVLIRGRQCVHSSSLTSCANFTSTTRIPRVYQF
ncbi:hypothetical protein CY34DRAFT_656199 [Suillus luteus UH-Slu-Lm8-n1]|uniref:Uncharacterized protein n=1 Tax=Suillus luteus UH-Slu-Lm8-n1 TaxID=930992 RepID=A0A0D0BCR9_9AGAM|nr:hypothetical protein CY34DRAFT_656199 [Suillus luteus UH-Slu-Lm8-n1]